jgi:hypothetical protein
MKRNVVVEEGWRRECGGVGACAAGRRGNRIKRPKVAIGVRPLEIDGWSTAEWIAAVGRYRRPDGRLSPELMGAEPYLSCHGHL